MWQETVDRLVGWVFSSQDGQVPDSALALALNFFIYDTVKIFLLLIVIIFAISLLRSFFPPEKTKGFLEKVPEFVGNILASLLGIVTPFCSCSAVPLFIGFIEAGVPLGVTFSFLVSAPMVNEVALVMLWGLFGWKIALLYIGSGLVVAIVSGAIIGRLHLEKWVEEYVYRIHSGKAVVETMTWRDRVQYAAGAVGEIVGKVWLYVIVGIAIGGFMHGYAPADLLARYAGPGAWYAVPLAVLIGVPLYSNAAGVIPIVKVLMEKGMALGTSLAFMMAVTALSLPEAVILRKVLKPRLLALYFGIVAIGIMLTGYLFNAVL
ncbi:MAG: permease [Spirochaetota bacterium]